MEKYKCTYFVLFCLSTQLFFTPHPLQSINVPDGWFKTKAVNGKGELVDVFAQPPSNGSKNNIQIGVGAGSTSGFSADDIGAQNAQSVATPYSWQRYVPQRSWQELLFSKESFCICCCAAGISYAVVYYQLQQAISLINDKNAWCNWKKEFSIERLYKIERKELAQELLHRIQTRYMNPKNPTDHIAPMNNFIEDYRKELLVFRRYFKLAKWFKKLHLTRLFPFKQKDMKSMKQSIERLCYLKNIFFSWTEDYKTKRCLKINATPCSPDQA